MRCLVVEDQPEHSQYIDLCLRSGSWEADLVGTVKDGYFKGTVNQYGCIILDWNLPDGDGLTLCHNLRQADVTTPILMLSVRDDVRDKVAGLETGADDYVTKPFAAQELLARLGALTRRGTKHRTCIYTCHDIRLETRARCVYRGGRQLKLTRREFDLLQFFMEHEGEVLTRADIWECVWGWDEYPLHNTVEVHVKRLRAKLGDRQQLYIQTLRGVGYRFQPPLLPDTLITNAETPAQDVGASSSRAG